MIEANCIEFSTRNIYNIHKDEIHPESLVFISEPGFEKLIAHKKEYLLVPSGGETGHVLKKFADGYGWALENNVNVSGNTGVSNLDPSYTFVLCRQTVASTVHTIGISGGKMQPGHIMTILVENTLDSVYTINIPNDDTYINLTPKTTTVSVATGEYAIFQLMSDGSRIFIKYMQ